MRNFEILKTDKGYVMHVDGLYVAVPEETLANTFEEREAQYSAARVDIKDLTPRPATAAEERMEARHLAAAELKQEQAEDDF